MQFIYKGKCSGCRECRPGPVGISAQIHNGFLLAVCSTPTEGIARADTGLTYRCEVQRTKSIWLGAGCVQFISRGEVPEKIQGLVHRGIGFRVDCAEIIAKCCNNPKVLCWRCAVHLQRGSSREGASNSYAGEWSRYSRLRSPQVRSAITSSRLSTVIT